jgi:hypothetical protein
VRHLAGTGSIADLDTLVTIARGGESDTPSLATWLNDFDAVYVIGVPAPNALPEHMDELARGDLFTAYAIRARGGAVR